MLNRVNHQVLKFKKSGIRKFAEAAAKIDGVVSLTIGEPEFDTELNIKNAAKKALDDNYTHYPSGQGILQLRQAIADFEDKSNAMHYTADEIIVTNGSTEGLASTFLALLNEGDEVIIPAPMYVTYLPMIEYCKAKLIPLDTTKYNFQIDEEALNALVNEHTKLIVITSPNNPTGVVLNKESLDAVKNVAKKHDIFILSDDVYHQLVYTDNFVKLSDDESIRHLLIVAQSYSKPYAMTGWRIGYLMADQPIAAHINSIHSYLVTGITSFIQVAAIEALNQDTSEIKRVYFNRLVKCKEMLDSANIQYVNPEGAFYLFINVSEFGLKSEDFCLKALHEYKVALVPGVYFSEFTDNYIRISYAVKENDLYEGLNRLIKMVQDIRQC
ncbi:MAG TPA: aminotransferase class I/II-fold pyridoxal phosphate-dependent enzyme [Erysipelotrichaceae bacterium]|nr:aminotransferase class I/II-fold pyridoxal phosphate-dependent enzyme [Erysipelotrichaceae bacterium]